MDCKLLEEKPFQVEVCFQICKVQDWQKRNLKEQDPVFLQGKLNLISVNRICG